MALEYALTLKDSSGESRAYPFDQDTVVVGRDPSADLVIDNIEISRSHLTVTREGDVFFAEDMQSTNGSFLNKKPLKKKTKLKDGDTIVLGQDHTLTLHVQQAEEPTDASAEATIEPAAAEAQAQDKPASDEKEEKMDAVISDLPDHADISAESKAPRTKGMTSGKKQRPKWLIILLAALAFIIVFCVIPLIVIEATNQWCDLFAGFFNSLRPGVCP